MYQRQIRIGGPLTPAVKILIIINVGFFLLQLVAKLLFNSSLDSPGLLDYLFGLSQAGLENLFIWQPFTYMFLHDGFLHLFFNLFALWMFGGELEQYWSSKRFTRFYLLAGLGAGLCIALANWLLAMRWPAFRSVPTIGASGAIYALLLAYGMIWPNREVMLYFLFPIKIKYLVIAYGAIEFFGTMSTFAGTPGKVSHTAHLGGLLAGFILIMIMRRSPSSTAKTGAKPKENFLSKLLRTRRLKRKRKVIEERIQAKQIIDTLLEKIGKEGMPSLTAKERQQLEWARKRYYPDENETIH